MLSLTGGLGEGAAEVGGFMAAEVFTAGVVSGAFAAGISGTFAADVLGAFAAGGFGAFAAGVLGTFTAGVSGSFTAGVSGSFATIVSFFNSLPGLFIGIPTILTITPIWITDRITTINMGTIQPRLCNRNP